jgi:hypothetical protein
MAEDYNLIECYSKLPIPNENKFLTAVDLLFKEGTVLSVLLGGSLSYKTDAEMADTDFFVLTNEAISLEMKLNEICQQLPSFDVVIYQGFFPWTQNLYTAYFKDDRSYSIDFCIVDIKNAADFFWEPSGIIVFDKNDQLAAIRKTQYLEMRFPANPFNKPNPHTLAVVTLKKIEKNLRRGHLWNALELLNIMRRYIMQIIRSAIIEPRPYLGRVDRDIEDVLPISMNELLMTTVACYNQLDIVEKAVRLADILLEQKKIPYESSEYEFRYWMEEEIKVIRCNLMKY